MRTVLLVIGAFVELLGILLVASPDLVPWALRFAGWIRPRWRRFENRLRRLLRLPHRGITHEVSLSAAIATGGRVSGVVDFNREAPLEEQVAFLLRRNVESQNETNALAARIAALEEETPGRLEALRAELEAHVSRSVATAKEDYRTARVMGVLVLVLGLVLTTLANLL
jgi:hypothetical protein